MKTKASVTASALAQHYRSGQGNEFNASRLPNGSLCVLGVVKDEKDGLWKIMSWGINLILTEGDLGV